MLLNPILVFSFCPDCWQVVYVVCANNYQPVGLLSVARNIFEIVMNNRFVDLCGNCVLFFDFQYGFKFVPVTVNLLTLVAHRIARVFDMSVFTPCLALYILKAFDRVLYTWYSLQT